MGYAEYEKHKHLHQEKVWCEPCGTQVCKYGLTRHKQTAGHLRAVGELPPTPAPPPARPRGRPKVHDTPWHVRNPNWNKGRKFWCECCQKEIPYYYMTSHRGTRAHRAAARAAGGGDF